MGCCVAKPQDVRVKDVRVTPPAPLDGGSDLLRSNNVQKSATAKSQAENGRTEPTGSKERSSPRRGSREGSKSRSLETVRTVMGKYQMCMDKENIMGEGTSSICRRGTNIVTGEAVAIKCYKASQKEGSKYEDVKMRKFERQIRVLKQLQEPFVECDEPSLWHEELASAKPSRLFMQLIDYSKRSDGEPGPDPGDGVLYVVTEVGQYSLKDYLALRRDQGRPLPAQMVRRITKAIINVMAGLHAKSLVHIDLKPENLMMFGGRLKLIDVDGCMKRGSLVSIQDSSISFSPCYCAPEWAKFLIEDSDHSGSRIKVMPSLDVWSAGMTICELVTLDAVLKPMYAKFLRNGNSHREAGFLFMEWLSSVKTAPLPKVIENYDLDFVDLLQNFLLVRDPQKRKTLAQSLRHPYILQGAGESSQVVNTQSQSVAQMGVVHTPRDSSSGGTEGLQNHIGPDQVPREDIIRNRSKDQSCREPLHKGTLWKLNSNGNPQDPTHWLKRDMWVASNGALCYFSIKDNRRLVLIETSKLVGAKISKLEAACKDIAFEVRTRSDKDEEVDDVYVFACDGEEDYNNWLRKIKSVSRMDHVHTMHLGEVLAQELDLFKLKVKNRRIKVEGDKQDQFAPVFKARLWKVKAEGDCLKDEDWFEREMWIAKNGSLVYWSKKEERELIYYTGDDMARATFDKVADQDSSKRWTFRVRLQPFDGVEFAPGEFAAESEQMRDRWFSEFLKWKSP